MQEVKLRLPLRQPCCRGRHSSHTRVGNSTITQRRATGARTARAAAVDTVRAPAPSRGRGGAGRTVPEGGGRDHPESALRSFGALLGAVPGDREMGRRFHSCSTSGESAWRNAFLDLNSCNAQEPFGDGSVAVWQCGGALHLLLFTCCRRRLKHLK